MAEGERRRRPAPMAATVVRTVSVTPSMVRVVLGGPGLAAFVASEHADSYVKLVFLHPDGAYPDPLDLDRVRAEMPAEHWPRLRTYTVRHWDGDAGELTIDVVVHGDRGLAGPWAAAARPGDVIHVNGPGGEYSPDPAAPWHLLVGDESALPAIAAAVERLPSDAAGSVLVEVGGPADEVPLAAPSGVSLTWLHRGPRPVGAALVDAVAGLSLPDGVAAFVHGEAGAVRELRRHLRADRKLPRERLSISGYWRLGADDEGWRAQKRSWNQAVEDAETAAGLA